MMCCHRADLRPGAYLSSPAGLFLVHGVRAGRGGVSECVVTDGSEPLTTERLPDPDAPDRLGRSLLLEPLKRVVPLHRVLADFDLLRHAPDPEDVASAAEFGAMGTAPE